MYISRILLDVSIPLVRHDLAGLNYLYETLSSAADGGRFVYRLDNVPLEKNNYLQPLVMVSEKRPDASKSGKPAGYFASMESFEYNIPVRDGLVYKFYLKANPSTKIFFFNSQVDLPDLQLKWLESESRANGFELIDARVSNDGIITCRERNVSLVSAVFEGSIKVKDEQKFSRMLNYGIGRGREYGLGLLSVESYGCKNRNMAEEMKAQAEREASQA